MQVNPSFGRGLMSLDSAPLYRQAQMLPRPPVPGLKDQRQTHRLSPVDISDPWLFSAFFPSPSRWPLIGLWPQDRAQKGPRTSAIEDAVRQSRWLLDLQDDWDDEGSPPIAEATWNVAAKFLRRQGNVYWKHHSKEIPAPHISPGSDGSIDIHWKTVRFELLVNIGESPDFSTSFYGDDYGRTKIKGSLNPVSETVYMPII